MKSYAETEGVTSFDWNAFLNRENITDDEWEEAEYFSDSWVTCACGNLCTQIPRHPDGYPIDPHLKWLGHQFNEAIELRMLNTAKETLQKIEQRSAEILSQLNTATS